MRCELGACVGASGPSIDDVPATEGCLDPFDAATVLPPAPESSGSCADPRSRELASLAQGCCLYRCFRGHHYYFCKPPANVVSGWERARERCGASAMKLVQIDDHRENDFVILTGMPFDLHPLWTGLNDVDDDAVWRWAGVSDRAGPELYRDGALVDPSAFSAIPPASLGFVSSCRDCAVLVSAANNAWSAQSIESGSYYYVCESE